MQARVVAEHESSLRLCGNGLRGADRAEVGHPGSCGQLDDAVVFGDDDQLVARLDDSVGRRVDHDESALHHAHHSGVGEGELRIEIGAANESRLHGEVDLITVEIEQLGVDDAQPALTAALHGDAADEVAREHPVRLVAADQLRRLHVAGILDLADDVVLLGSATWVVGQGKGGLDDNRVRVGAVFRSKDDDAARRVRAADLEIGEIHRIAGSHDDPGFAWVRNTGSNLVFHLDLVAVGNDDDGRAATGLVGDADLADHGKHLAAPAEDQSVVGLEHLRATLAQVFDLRVKGARDDADEARHDDEAADGDREHESAEPRAGVATHRPRIERAEHAVPQCLPEICGGVVRALLNKNDHCSDDEDEDDSDRGEQADEGDSALRHEAVEPVAETL